MIYRSQGRYDEALQSYNQSLRIEQTLGNQAGIAESLHEIGIIHQLQGRYDQALQHYNQSLQIGQRLDNQADIADSFRQIGLLHTVRSENKIALRYLLRARLIFQSLNAPQAEQAENDLSHISQQIGETAFNEAIEAEMQQIERDGPLVINLEGGTDE